MSSVEKTFNVGDVIIKEGDIGNSFFKIIKGDAGVYCNYGKDDQVKLTVLDDGQFFGEMAVIEAFPRSTSVVAESEISVIEYQGDELNTYFSEDPDRVLGLMRQLGIRLRELTDEYNEAKDVLNDLKASSEAAKSESFISKIMKHISRYNSGKSIISEPSAEALREAAGKVSKDSDNLETYAKGTVISKKGDTAKCMYIIHGGSVGIYSNFGESNQVKLTTLYPTTCFGEMGLIADLPRSATAVSEDDNTFVEIVRPDDLADMFKTSPVKVDMILRHVSYRLRQLTYDYLTVCKEISDNYGK